jgi:DNA-directed RNA polymerase I subunit RPA2
MYSGITGELLEADIFVGLVYYQRLRHMVSDKSQARATGPCDILTQQPLKGRKKGGGIRVGEMERDTFLSHGLSFAVHERLFKSSDYSEGVVCKLCGSIISSYLKSSKLSGDMVKQVRKVELKCTACGGACVKVPMPFVLRYLTNELALMNIKLRFNTE